MPKRSVMEGTAAGQGLEVERPDNGTGERTRCFQAIAGRMVATVLLAFALRVFLLAEMSLRGDEALSVIYAQRSLSEILRITRFVSGHPPLFYTLLHFWEAVAGTTEFAARFFAAWWGVLTVALVFTLGRLLFAPRPALAAALLVAVNPFHVMIAQDVRSYTMLAALSLLSSCLFWRALHRSHWKGWACYALSGMLVVHCHYFGSFTILAHGAFFVYYRLRRRGPWGKGILSFAAIVATLAPWLWLARSVLAAGHGAHARDLPLGEMFQQSLVTFGVGYWRESWGERLITAGLVLLLGWGLWKAFRRPRVGSVFAALAILAPSLCLYVLSRSRPLFEERYLVASAPMYALFLGLALTPLERLQRPSAWIRRAARWLGMAFLIGFGAYALVQYYVNPAYAKSPEWREAVLYLKRQMRSSDIVILNHQDQAFLYYYGKVDLHVLPAPGESSSASVGDALQGLTYSHERVWLLPDTNGLWDAEGVVWSWLDRNCEPVLEASWRGITLLLYHTPRRYEAEMRPLDVRLKDDIRLLGYVVRDSAGRAVHELEIGAGEAVQLTLYWRADAAIAEDYTVFTHLLDPTGWLRGQQDNPPRGGTLPTSAWVPQTWVIDQYDIVLASDGPSGDYAIEVGMYHPDSGSRLSVGGRDGDAANRRVLLRDIVHVR